MLSREQLLEAMIRQLLDATELNMDDMEDETRQLIRRALTLLGDDRCPLAVKRRRKRPLPPPCQPAGKSLNYGFPMP